MSAALISKAQVIERQLKVKVKNGEPYKQALNATQQLIKHLKKTKKKSTKKKNSTKKQSKKSKKKNSARKWLNTNVRTSSYRKKYLGQRYGYNMMVKYSCPKGTKIAARGQSCSDGSKAKVKRNKNTMKC